jgi:prepilin-type N-terminal cleavage/methylation domain-containing protein
MLRIINKLKNKRGFTLIELIVVLAVLAIILAIAVPRFIGIQKQARIDSDYSTGALIAKAAELYEAREEAEPNNAKELIDEDYISAVQFQSKTLEDVEPDDVTIDIEDNGAITVKAKVGGVDWVIYPKPTDDTDLITE